jgi:hypothetical protein
LGVFFTLLMSSMSFTIIVLIPHMENTSFYSWFS